MLPGRWASPSCESWPGAPFVRREYRFDGRNFTRIVTRFMNSACSMPTYRLRTEGTYHLVRPSGSVPGAIDIDFKPGTIGVTPLTTNAADTLNMSTSAPCVGSAWLAGSEQAIVPAQGCPDLLVLPFRGGTEFDIVRNDGNVLSLGLWPADGLPPTLPERRPTLFAPGINLVQSAAVSTILLPDTGADLSMR